MKKGVVVTLVVIVLISLAILMWALFRNTKVGDNANDMYNDTKNEVVDIYNDTKNKIKEEKDEMKNDGNVEKQEVAKDEDVIAGVLDDIVNTAEFDNVLKPAEGNKEPEKLSKEEFIKRKDEFKSMLKNNMTLFKTSVENGVNYVEYETSKVFSALGFSIKDGTITKQESKRIKI